jgi:hypothetical protein
MNPFKPDETMLNNYIQNKLSEGETEKLELWLADHPDVMQDLELGVMFKQADFEPSIAKEKTQNWLQKLFSKPTLVFSHVAVFALGIFLLNLLLIDKPIDISSPNVTMFSQTRGVDDTYQLSNSKDLLIQIPVEYLSQSLYEITISGQGGYQFNVSNLKADSDIVSLYIPKEKLVNGAYVLEVTNQDSKDKTNYNFEIRIN